MGARGQKGRSIHRGIILCQGPKIIGDPFKRHFGGHRVGSITRGEHYWGPGLKLGPFTWVINYRGPGAEKWGPSIGALLEGGQGSRKVESIHWGIIWGQGPKGGVHYRGHYSGAYSVGHFRGPGADKGRGAGSTCANCTVGSYASLSVCLSGLDQKSLENNLYLRTYCSPANKQLTSKRKWS